MKKFLSEVVWKNYQRHVVVTIVSIALIIFLIPIATYAYFARDLKTKESLMNRNDAGVTLLDRNNEPFFTFYEAKNKTYVTLDQIPDVMKNAIIASEDREFYNHPGFSIRGIVRSFILNFKKTDLAYGGSTLTQQLVKNALLTPRKSFLRKYQEIVLASEVERRFSKNEILEMYLNSVYFGAGAFGVEEAAQTYFGKSAKDITLAEASILTTILPAPTRLSPFNASPELVKERQQMVLNKMIEQKYITNADKITAEKQELTFDEPKDAINNIAPHFAIMVRDELIKEYGEERVARSGYKVKTTLNSEWQRFAEQTVAEQVERLKPNRVSNGAVVVMDPKTGEVHALVGSKSWADEGYGKFNVTTAARQPGSSFKPIVYAEALERNVITPATQLKDEPTTFKTADGTPYKPVNYDRKFRGRVLPRRALANSLNVASVDVINRLGVENAIDAAQDMGISTIDNDLSRYGLSLVLGAAEAPLIQMTGAYAAFASYGEYHKPTLILEILDKSEQPIYKYVPTSKRVLEPETAFLISSYLSDSGARQEVFGNTLSISRPAAVKTGTTDDYKDAWTLGYTPSLTIGVWVGNNDGTPMDQIAGSLGAAPIWRILMEKFLAGTPVEQFQPPNGMVRTTVCSFPTAEKDKPSTPSAITEYFPEGTQPREGCVVPSPSPSGSTTPSPTPRNEGQEKKEQKKDEPTKTPTPNPTATPAITATPSPAVTLQVTVGPTEGGNRGNGQGNE